MKLDFTRTQVMMGAVDNRLEDFLRNLWEEAKSNISKEELNNLPEGKERDNKYNEAIREVFHFIYEVCYLAAVKKPYLKMALERSSEEERKIIKKTIKENKANIDILHAILMKHMKRGLNKGFTRKQAAKSAIEYSNEVISKWSKEEHVYRSQKKKLKRRKKIKNKNVS